MCCPPACVFRELVSAVDYLHSNLIMHGDLKPDNLLLSADGRLTVSDFGSATVLVSLNASACWACQPCFTLSEASAAGALLESLTHGALALCQRLDMQGHPPQQQHGCCQHSIQAHPPRCHPGTVLQGPPTNNRDRFAKLLGVACLVAAAAA